MKMKKYVITFVVQAEDMLGACRQAERYLNTGDRVVDFDARSIMALSIMALPKEAPVLPTDEN